MQWSHLIASMADSSDVTYTDKQKQRLKTHTDTSKKALKKPKNPLSNIMKLTLLLLSPLLQYWKWTNIWRRWFTERTDTMEPWMDGHRKWMQHVCIFFLLSFGLGAPAAGTADIGVSADHPMRYRKAQKIFRDAVICFGLLFSVANNLSWT